MKRISALLLTLTLFLVLAMPAFAVQEEQACPMVYYLGEQAIKDNFFDENGRTQVNIDAFVKTFGLEYELTYPQITGMDGITVGHPNAITIYDVSREEVESPHKNTILSFAEGEYRMICDGAEVSMDTTAIFANNGIYVPLRYAAEALGYAVAWDSESKSVYIDRAISAEKRLGIAQITVTDSCIWYGYRKTTYDFVNCQKSGSGDVDYGGAYSYSTYLSADRHAAFFAAAAEHGLLSWSDKDWPQNGPGLFMDITDQVYYTITLVFDDGTEQALSGYTIFPKGWNEMSAAFSDLSGQGLPTGAPSLFPDEHMSIISIKVQKIDGDEEQYRWDIMPERVSRSYLDAETKKQVWQSYSPDREAQLAFFDTLRTAEILSWNSPGWPQQKAVGGNSYRLTIEYHSDVPLKGEDNSAWPTYYYAFDITAGGENGYPKNWEALLPAFEEMFRAAQNENN